MTPTPEKNPRGAATGRDAVSARIVSMGPGGLRERQDWLAAEEPLEIRAFGPGQPPVSVAVTMRTPGHDSELAIGFLLTEGLITGASEVASAGPGRAKGVGGTCNTVQVGLTTPFDGSSLRRNFFATSSCGICGKATIDQVAVRCPPIGEGPVVSAATVVGLPDTLRSAQSAFEKTGGLHAAGLFDREGRLQLIREDVGRHNAVDKVVGRMAMEGKLPLAEHLLLVSGRSSFEILQKAALAGLPIVCAVSAPSSLAVATANRLGVTLVGFLRGSGFNIYSHPLRIRP